MMHHPGFVSFGVANVKIRFVNEWHEVDIYGSGVIDCGLAEPVTINE